MFLTVHPVNSNYPFQATDLAEFAADAAFAIQFPEEGAYTTAPVEKPQYRHGDAVHPTTIWYWNAGSVDPAVEPRTTLLDGTARVMSC